MMKGNRWAPSQGPAMGRSVMVATAQPLATQAGLDVLRDGGNAVDAAVCISMLLAVTKPMRCQVGGDVFYLIYWAETGKVTAINGSGVAPGTATLEAYASGLPDRGIRASAVPGFVDGVLEARNRFGSRSLQQLMQPAIGYARDGFPISLRLATLIAQHADVLRSFPATGEIFLPSGRLPQPGEILQQQDLSRTLEAIAADGRDGFYKGAFAAALLKVSAQQGGHYTPDDLPAHYTVVTDPVTASYRGLTVYEQPPVSQGHIVLEELGILEGFDLAGRSPEEPDLIHLMVEAKKLAFADARQYAGDPEQSAFAVEHLLTPGFLAERRRSIDPRHASESPAAGKLEAMAHDTTSFAVVDAAGNAVAAIQSVFQPWGSGVVVDGTGVLLNNRLDGFVLEAGHPNALHPGKRPVHTLNQYIVTKDSRPVLIGGTPGGQQQVQTNIQVISAIVDAGCDVQTALDLPRWGHTAGFDVSMESRYDDGVYAELERRGHRVHRTGPWEGLMGRAAVISIDQKTGVRMGALDLRSEGAAAGW